MQVNLNNWIQALGQHFEEPLKGYPIKLTRKLLKNYGSNLMKQSPNQFEIETSKWIISWIAKSYPEEINRSYCKRT